MIQSWLLLLQCSHNTFGKQKHNYEHNLYLPDDFQDPIQLQSKAPLIHSKWSLCQMTCDHHFEATQGPSRHGQENKGAQRSDEKGAFLEPEILRKCWKLGPWQLLRICSIISNISNHKPFSSIVFKSFPAMFQDKSDVLSSVSWSKLKKLLLWAKESWWS